MTFHCLRIQPSPGIHLRSQRRTYFQCTIHTYISVKVHLIKITETKTREVAVVGKETTVVYAESGRKQLLKCVSVGKISQGQPKSKKCGGSIISAILPNMMVLGQVIGILKSKNPKVGQCVWAFYEVYP